MKFFLFTLILSICLCSSASFASSLVYTPVNPSFGGHALNGNYLLSNAAAQNSTRDPNSIEDEESPLSEFNSRLQRSLLSRLTSTIASNFVDESGSLIPGQTVTEDFIIDVVDEGDGTIRVTTTDRTTGDSTTFIVESQGL